VIALDPGTIIKAQGVGVSFRKSGSFQKAKVGKNQLNKKVSF
jgi:hypothetical protein